MVRLNQFCILIDYGYSTSVFSHEPELPRPSFTVPAAIEPPPVPPPIPPALALPTQPVTADNIFADKITPKDLDVTSIITKRLNAMRKLQENPMDSEAIKLMYRTQKDVCAVLCICMMTILIKSKLI